MGEGRSRPIVHNGASATPSSLGLEASAQMADAGLDRGDAAARRVISPDAVDQTLGQLTGPVTGEPFDGT